MQLVNQHIFYTYLPTLTPKFLVSAVVYCMIGKYYYYFKSSL